MLFYFPKLQSFNFFIVDISRFEFIQHRLSLSTADTGMPIGCPDSDGVSQVHQLSSLVKPYKEQPS
jgi:hypothetical protein